MYSGSDSPDARMAGSMVGGMVGNANLGQTPMGVPAFSPADYYKVQSSIKEILDDLRLVAPALDETHKMDIMLILGKDVMNGRNPGIVQYDVDQVVAQYELVLKIRSMVLDPDNRFHERTDAKGLSALVNAINGTITLFLKHQEKIEHLKNIRSMGEAFLHAVKELPVAEQQKFLERLEELQRGY